MAVIDLTADEPPITVERLPDGNWELGRNGAFIRISEAEVTEFLRIARPAQTPAKLMRYRMG